MKLNTNANGYIIVYSCLMVVIVAFLLAFVSSALKPQQDLNVALDKKKQVLAALNIRDLSDSEAEKKYGEVVKKDEAFASTAAITRRDAWQYTSVKLMERRNMSFPSMEWDCGAPSGDMSQ